MTKRRKFSEQFQREAIRLTRQPGASISQIGRDIGVNANPLSRWRRELDGQSRGQKQGTGLAKAGVKSRGQVLYCHIAYFLTSRLTVA